jgi:hypothetical protein
MVDAAATVGIVIPPTVAALAHERISGGSSEPVDGVAAGAHARTPARHE